MRVNYTRHNITLCVGVLLSTWLIYYIILNTATDWEKATNQHPPLPRDCTYIFSQGNHTSGIYKIHPHTPQGLYHSIKSNSVNVYCDMDIDGGGWTVFQRRYNGLVGFYRDWEDYKHGFGYADGEYWLGLQNLHWLTYTAQYELRVDIEDFNGNLAYAKYSSFNIADEGSLFTLILGEYTGTASDSLNIHRGMSFSTRDQDHDTHDSAHCAQKYTGAWWYADCHTSNLNGLYTGSNEDDPKGMVWHHRRVLKKSEMKIRRIQ